MERVIHFEYREISANQDRTTRIRIETPGQPTYLLTNEFSWWIKLSDSLPNGFFASRRNALPSQYIFAARTFIDQTPHTFLFLLGWPFGSSPGSLHIVDLEGRKPPRTVLRKEELELVDFRDLDADGVPEIIGAPCTSQEFGEHLLTYDPFHVYVIRGNEPAKLSLLLSRSYNHQHYFGWVGPNCSEEWVIVLHPSGGNRPVIVRATEVNKLKSKAPQH